MDYIKKLEILVQNLRKSQKVKSYDSPQEREADTLGHSLLDMEESFKVIMNDHIPRLMQNNITEKEIDDVLFEIGDELRHILYHIKDPKFYEYLKDDS